MGAEKRNKKGAKKYVGIETHTEKSFGKGVKKAAEKYKQQRTKKAVKRCEWGKLEHTFCSCMLSPILSVMKVE